MASGKSTPVTTRGRKGSVKDSVSYDDFSKLLRESEDRIRKDMQQVFQKEISTLKDKLERFESRFSFIHQELVRIDGQYERLKELVVSQQLQIEQGEKRARECNLILHNIPETDLSTSTSCLKSDDDKIKTLIQTAKIDVNMGDVVSIQRIGKSHLSPGGSKQRQRPIKISLKDKDKKYKILNKRREISQNTLLKQTFHNKIFVNSDSSFLVQKEEYRLRQHLKEIKSDNSSASAFIRAGVLYVDGSEVDKIDIKKQLF